MSRTTRQMTLWSHVVPLVLLVLAALGLRLLVWQWHELYPLGGDEREYLEQALTLLRERRYVELPLMRPPLYTLFLAGCIYLLDSLVQQLRLVQACISAFTVVPIYAIAWQIWRERRIAIIAGALTAASMTLAVTATELLTETVFLFGLAVAFWCVLRAMGAEVPRRAAVWALAAGVAIGILALVRSVALPLLPLATLWLLAARWAHTDTARRRAALIAAIALACGGALMIAPWTARNYMQYGGLIIIDTTGAENLWLDNDPAGREVVKQQLYALGDDKMLRQRLATERGIAVIVADPQRFAAKAWRETTAFFALQYFDDMRARQAIWVPPAEVWLRLLLGDGLWLLLLIAGTAGMWRAPAATLARDPRWVFVPWCLYGLATAMLFHVELRYRLPLVPALAPYAAWQIAALVRAAPAWRNAGAALTTAALIGLTLLHRPYPAEAWTLANKHIALWRAEVALANSDLQTAANQADAALASDAESALARTVQARAALLQANPQGALVPLDAALAAVPDHPYAHVLRGIARRAIGDVAGAQADLAYETASLEGLQERMWREMPAYADAPSQYAIGDGLDLGFVRGFYAAERAKVADGEGYRWSSGEAILRLGVPTDAAQLRLRLAAGRPAGVAPPEVVVSVAGRELTRLRPTNEWQEYRIPLPADFTEPGLQIVVTLQSDTFQPRALDRTSDDNRTLGVMVGFAAIDGSE